MLNVFVLNNHFNLDLKSVTSQVKSTKMRNCFVPGCDQICKGISKRRMFCAPKDQETFHAWMSVLPKNRKFKAHDKVCERHFLEEDISTTYDNLVQGVLYKIERGRPRLRLKAVPCRNLDVPNNKRTQNNRKVARLEPAAVEQLKELMRVEVSPTKEKEEHSILLEVHEEQHLEIEEVQDIQEVTTDRVETATTATECASAVNGEHLESIEISEVHDSQELFESLYDDIYEVVLPNTLWGVHRCPERSSVFFSYVDPSALRTSKMITINNQGLTKIVLGNRLLNEDSLVFDINSIEALSDAVSQIDEMKLCPGIFDNEFCEVTLKEDADICVPCAESEMHG